MKMSEGLIYTLRCYTYTTYTSVDAQHSSREFTAINTFECDKINFRKCNSHAHSLLVSLKLLLLLLFK